LRRKRQALRFGSSFRDGVLHAENPDVARIERSKKCGKVNQIKTLIPTNAAAAPARGGAAPK
jgi:hypothetical protein